MGPESLHQVTYYKMERFRTYVVACTKRIMELENNERLTATLNSQDHLHAETPDFALLTSTPQPAQRS